MPAYAHGECIVCNLLSKEYGLLSEVTSCRTSRPHISGPISLAMKFLMGVGSAVTWWELAGFKDLWEVPLLPQHRCLYSGVPSALENSHKTPMHVIYEVCKPWGLLELQNSIFIWWQKQSQYPCVFKQVAENLGIVFLVYSLI